MPTNLQFHWYPSLGSTNDEALSKPWPQGTIIAADHQKGGRGRLGRSWQSPPGLNLYFSLVFYPALPVLNWGGFSLAVGAALGRALSPFLPSVGVKWPNDLLVGGKKIGGILLETQGGKLVAGIGINVNQPSFPPELSANSLCLCTGKKWRRDRLLGLLAPAAFSGLQLWDQGRFLQILDQWRSLDILLGQQVRVRRGTEILFGQVQTVDADGRLVIKDPQGTEHRLVSGEVTLGDTTNWF